MNSRFGFRFVKSQFGARVLVLVALPCVGAAGPAFSQAPPIWSGQAQCQLNMQGSDYVHQEVQTWTITGASTSAPGAMPIYPGTWSVAGQGANQRTSGSQVLSAQWNTKVPETSAPIAVFVRASDNRLLIKPWHSQLRVPSATTGTRQLVPASGSATQSPVDLAAFEWPFPVIEDASNSTKISGSGTIVVSGGLLPLQSPTVNGTATCKWQFHQGVDALPPPASVTAANLARSPNAANSPLPVSISNAGAVPPGASGASGSGSKPGGAAGGAGTAGAASGGGAAGGAGTAGAASGGGAAGGAGTAGAASGGGAAGGAGTAGAASSGATDPAKQGSTLGANQQNTGAQAGCTDPGLLQGSSSPYSPNIIGTIPSGGSASNAGNLTSASDRKFYQFTLPAGVDASISLSGMQAGADFDLYAYHSDLTPIGCSLTRGTSSENIKTSFGATQSSNAVIVEVKPYSWNTTSTSYSLSVNGLTFGSGNVLPGGLQSRAAPVAQQGTSSSSVPQSCVGASMAQGIGNPIIIGTMSAGQSIVDPGNLTSATDRHFYQITLSAGTDANISLSGMQAGSDFDLYVYRSDLTPIGCSLTRGTSSENFKTTFGASQSSNTVLVEVRSYAWSTASPSYSLSVNGLTFGSGNVLPGGLQSRAAPVAQQGTSSSSVPQSCVGASMAQGIGNPIIIGTMSAGQSIVDPGNLTSATDRHFYQITLSAGTDANISLSGMQAGSDFDLYVYRSDLTPIGCSLTRGTSSENFKTTFGASQSSNTVLVEVRSYAWSTASPSYSLSVNGLTFGSGNVLPGGLQSRAAPVAQQGTSSSSVPPSCVGASMAQGIGNATIIGTMSAGQSIVDPGNLTSATDRHFYQITLSAGTDANISLGGMQAGSDFDLYVYRSDLTPIGCSLTRGTSSENIKTTFGASQSSNTVIVEVRSYAWSTASPSYSLSVNGSAADAGAAQSGASSKVIFQPLTPLQVSKTSGSDAGES